MDHHFFVSLLVAAVTLFLALVAAAAAEIASRLALSSANKTYHVHRTFSGTPGLVVNTNVDQFQFSFSCLHCVSRLRNITQCQHGGHGAGNTLPLRGDAILSLF